MQSAFVPAEQAAGHLTADIQPNTKGQNQGRELRQSMGKDRRQESNYGVALRDIPGGQHAQGHGVDAQSQRRELDEGDQSVDHNEYGGPQIVGKECQSGQAAVFIHDAHTFHGGKDHGEQAVPQGGEHRTQSEGEHHQNGESDGGPQDFTAETVLPGTFQPADLILEDAFHARSFSMPKRRRRRVSSLPRMWHSSTAPPGVTSLPATAMRTGHMRVAFFTSREAARSIRVS